MNRKTGNTIRAANKSEFGGSNIMPKLKYYEWITLICLIQKDENEGFNRFKEAEKQGSSYFKKKYFTFLRKN